VESLVDRGLGSTGQETALRQVIACGSQRLSLIVAGYRGGASVALILVHRTLSQARGVIDVSYSDRRLLRDLVYLHERCAEDVVVESWLLAQGRVARIWCGAQLTDVRSLLIEHVISKPVKVRRLQRLRYFRQAHTRRDDRSRGMKAGQHAKSGKCKCMRVYRVLC
jgi:hypothetical protein